MRILIVDATSSMRRVTRNFLQRVGFEDTIEAANGQEALEVVAESDFILMDWYMPAMGGPEFVKRARALKELIPILLLTTDEAREDIFEALKAGVNGFVLKPLTPKVLKERIEAALK